MVYMPPSFIGPAGFKTLMFLGLILTGSAEAKRLALVIGNDSYQNMQPLKNAPSDAKAIATELKAVGFEVTLKQDLTQITMKSSLRDFKSQVANEYGDHSHGTINSADPNNIIVTSICHLGNIGGVQRRYPDWSISTQGVSQGRLVNGVMSGSWYDKFQTGEFQLTVGDGK